MFPDNVRSKSDPSKPKPKPRNRKLTRRNNDAESLLPDEVQDERRKAREQAALDRRRKIKSELYIRDSDEEMDEGENRAFFAREEENRKMQAERVRAALGVGRVQEGGATTGRMKRKRKEEGRREGREGKRRRRRRRQSGSESGSEDEGMDEEGDDEMETIEAESDSSPQEQTVTSDDELDIENTPLSSPSQVPDAGSSKVLALREIPQARRNSPAVSKGLEAEDSDDELPVLASQRRRVRAGFILDDSDE